MTPNSTQFIRATTQISHTQNQQTVIREGSTVLVRIIADKGGGKYEASVAGNRLILTSEKSLKAGSTFVGKIELQNGQILISKNGIEATLTSPALKTSTFLETGGIFEKILSPELSGFLQAMNLPADNLSFHILLQYKQLGMKLNPAIMNKIRQIAAKSQNPKATAEKLITLVQKGIDIGNVNKVFSNLEDDFHQHSKNNNSNLHEDSKRKNDNTKFALPIFNSLGFGKNHQNENSWVFLPFEIENLAEKSIVGNGIVKLLLRSNDKSLQMMNIEINYDEKSYRFLINFEARKITSVKYALQDGIPADTKIYAENKSITENLRSHLCTSNPEISVEWIPYDLIDGTASGLEEFSLAGGFV